MEGTVLCYGFYLSQETLPSRLAEASSMKVGVSLGKQHWVQAAFNQEVRQDLAQGVRPLPSFGSFSLTGYGQRKVLC